MKKFAMLMLPAATLMIFGVAHAQSALASTLEADGFLNIGSSNAGGNTPAGNPVAEGLGSALELTQGLRDTTLGEAAGTIGDVTAALDQSVGLIGSVPPIAGSLASDTVEALAPVAGAATGMAGSTLGDVEGMAAPAVGVVLQPQVVSLAGQVVQATGQTVTVSNVGNGQITDVLALTRGNGTLVGNVDNRAYSGGSSSGTGAGGTGGDSGQGGFLFSNSGNAGGGGNGGLNNNNNVTNNKKK